jgi:4-amino-4-deoxy-L-arabinose transferase-like glycosyltransferase
MSCRLSYLIVIAFLFRIALGVGSYFYLPHSGHADSQPQQAGYLFFDAFRRDSQAWDLAQSAKPLDKAFDQKFSSDQYGGLLWLSTFVYRYLGGTTHQPLFMVALAALIGSLGGFFVYLAARRLVDEKVALLATFIFLFYPESILFGAAQMREPFLMTFIAMAFYGLVSWQSIRQTSEAPKNGKTSEVYGPWLWMGLALAGMLFISPGFVLVTLVAAAGWVYFSDNGRKIPWQGLAVAAGIFVVALVALSLSWNALVAAKGGGIFGVIGNWARETAKWNQYILGRSSGIVQLLFQALPRFLATPFVAVYGILQPVLPAAIFEPSVPFWQILGIIRALGWYLLLPLLAFAPFAAAKIPAGESKRRWVWLGFVIWAWILIAAVRGGGDQWDNPRYRVILLAWQALLAAQAFYAIKTRWFWRILGIEAIILLVFGHWYVYRYLGLGFNLGIRLTLVIAIGAAILLVAGDWAWEKIRARKS